MTDTDDLHVAVRGLDIIVTMPGTKHRITFQQPADGRQLIPTPEQMPAQKEGSISREAFIARAWEAANAKARELGWIV
jgi:hypothetical protein